MDPSMDDYIVETKDLKKGISVLFSLGQGSSVEVTPRNSAFLLSLSREFDNSDLFISLVHHFDVYPFFPDLDDGAFPCFQILQIEQLRIGSHSNFSPLSRSVPPFTHNFQ
jgi:hypothetical protein